MNITIRGAHYIVSEEIRNRVEEKVKAAEKLLGHESGTALATVELALIGDHRSGERFSAVVNVDTGSSVVHAAAVGETMESAIDKVESELLHELRNKKGKGRSIVRRTGAAMKGWMQSWRN